MDHLANTTSPTKAARVAELVRDMVHDGRLAEGDTLPSTRALAAELGLSRGTVTAAYEQLDGEGYVVLRHGAVPRVAATLGGTRQGLPSAGTDARAHPAPSAPGSTAPPRAVVDLRPGVPSAAAVSERDWRAAWRHAAARPVEATYPDPAGEPALRTQVANQLTLSRGFTPDPDRVVVTGGTAEAISLVTESLTAPDHAPRVAVENPGFRAGRRAIASAGGAVVPVPVVAQGMDLGALRAAHARERLDAVLVTPSHQYPLGGAMPVAARHRLLAWAAAECVLVVEDDYDSEFRHRGAPLPALAALDDRGVVVHVGSFSKVLDPGLRCGYLVLPVRDDAPDGGTPAAVLAARSGRGATVASVTQHALAHLMSTGALRRHVARCRRDYRAKRRTVAETFEGVPGVRVGALDGGLHAVLELDRTPAADLVARLAARGVLVADLQDYVVPGSGLTLNGIVLGYAPPSGTSLRDALRTIRAELGPEPRP
ncbi:pyridoxine biosynthesis transcriptional regulator PdxR [Isoptericola halotolerans]|uniref:GntR family transcriptional regulator/MocR family aminotransferase n=1 Tax=Isoptericola halotolerans TaxID=300560 RepID=A0ABX1ZYP2_9MICO|nr:PLP-dependent aminotransferase family protein [Isoptericola halotolerans]NOV95725.1 GntR family transcriptional regulator/MocR family aminotransferase [Isoptericola halotolerans]